MAGMGMMMDSWQTLPIVQTLGSRGGRGGGR